MDKIYFLIDTNIFIQLEDNQIVKESFAKFHNLCNKHSVVIFTHPLSREEIEKDKNKQRRDETLSKIDKYTQIEDPPSIDKTQLESRFGAIKKSNDEIDCQMLYTLIKNAVSFLVTEDIGIHQRAKLASIKNKVLTVNQANNMLERLFPKPIEFSLPEIKNTYIRNVNHDDIIFDSLNSDYDNFADWIKKCSIEQVKAWIIKNSEDKLESICIYKEAKNEDYTLYDLPKKSLKLATFKVAESHRGKKLGELMLKQAFLYSVKNNFKSCWMTVFSRYEILIGFIKDFGFFEIGKTKLIDKKTNKPELVFKKDFTKPKKSELKGLDFHIKHFPFYDDSNDIGKYIIPIKKKYHKTLFPEYEELFSPPLVDNQYFFPGMDRITNNIPGHTIKKVYLCHSPTTQLKLSDLLLFYISSPKQAICSMGIIESVFRSDKLSKIVSHIGKRSVYSFSEIQEMTKRETLVIAFRLIKHFKKEVSFNTLKKEQIIKGPPQSIQKLKNESYDKFNKLVETN